VVPTRAAAAGGGITNAPVGELDRLGRHLRTPELDKAETEARALFAEGHLQQRDFAHLAEDLVEDALQLGLFRLRHDRQIIDRHDAVP
jgi:hypothetical protein